MPAEAGPVWSCYMRSPCGRGREAVLTGWSAEAPPVALPKGVSYSVGAGTGIRHVVLQVMDFDCVFVGARASLARISLQEMRRSGWRILAAAGRPLPADMPSSTRFRATVHS